MDGTPHLFAMRHVLICLMLALTLISQFWIIPRMDTLRASVGDFASVAVNNPARVQFDALHVWSTRVEGGVLLLGLVVVYLTARAFWGWWGGRSRFSAEEAGQLGASLACA